MATATAAERRVAMCSVRGALQTLHNAASLVKQVDVGAERMLRTAEGLARAAVSRLEFVHREAAKSSAEVAAPQCSEAAALAAGPAARRKRKKKKAAKAMVVDGQGASGEEPAGPLQEQLVPTPRVLPLPLDPVGDAAFSLGGDVAGHQVLESEVLLQLAAGGSSTAANVKKMRQSAQEAILSAAKAVEAAKQRLSRSPPPSVP